MTARPRRTFHLPDRASQNVAFGYTAGGVIEDSPLRRMYLDGQRAWPLLHVEFEAFARHCIRALAQQSDAAALQYGPELYLCCACVLGNGEAQECFRSDGVSVARAAIARINSDREFVEETLQEVWDKLLVGPDAKVAEYSGRGPLHAWLRVTAARTALDRHRAQQLATSRCAELSDGLADQLRSPESSLTRARYTDAFQQAVERAVATLSTRDRRLLRMHILGHCSIDQIGHTYGVHRATAARWLDKARAHVFESVRQHVARAYPALTDSEFRSVARSIHGDLELRLSASADEGAPASAPSAAGQVSRG